jgi:DNA-binding transcriptional regulator YdaS (Cro superfamily)
MKLQEYLDTYGTPKMALARKAGISRPSLNGILDGRDLRISVALKLEDATAGLVTCREMAPLAYEAALMNKTKNKKKRNNKR